MRASQASLTVGALSRQTGVNIETVRYYERIGLLPRPLRGGGGYRLYGLDDVKRLSFVRRARDLGFTLDEVRALLGLAGNRARSCRKVHALAVAHLDDVQAKMADLRKLERVLREMVSRCAEGTLPDCPLIEALFTGGAAIDIRATRPTAEA
jgi:MerR family mercuric resistance operon transcriptional regulator